jgi:hypothetical protein
MDGVANMQMMAISVFMRATLSAPGSAVKRYFRANGRLTFTTTAKACHWVAFFATH